mmetsp:Transcript_4179/g.12238  ORF Transcript_4179/g.12238 Transcript_4179/m.12238 type:complete len:94 (+) Transcript_4179:3-284(+)
MACVLWIFLSAQAAKIFLVEPAVGTGRHALGGASPWSALSTWCRATDDSRGTRRDSFDGGTAVRMLDTPGASFSAHSGGRRDEHCHGDEGADV